MLFAAGAPNSIKLSVGTVLLAFSVNVLPYSPEWWRQLFSLPAIGQLGLWSFSLYLWQQPFADIKTSSYLYKIVPLLAGAFIAALISFYLVERPARKALNAFWQARSASTKLSAAPV